MSDFQNILKGIGGNITHVPIINGRRVKPTSATVTITTNGGDDLPTPVSAEAATINSETGVVTYAVTAANAVNQSNNYRARFTVVYDSGSYIRDEFYNVVKAIHYYKLHEESVYSEMPSLRNTDSIQTVDDWISHAFSLHLEHDLRARGIQSYQMVRTEDLKQALLFKTIELMAQQMTEEVDDIWDSHRQRYRDSYMTSLRGVKARDVDETGFLNDSESNINFGRMRVVR